MIQINLSLFFLVCNICMATQGVYIPDVNLVSQIYSHDEPTNPRSGAHVNIAHGDEIPKVSRIPEGRGDLVCNLDPGLIAEIRGYQSQVDQIISYVTRGEHKGKTYDSLATLVDTFGARMTGTTVLENSIDWILGQSTSAGFDKVYTENVLAPHWVRNNESAMLIFPRQHKLNILGLGSSVGTTPEGITAEVLVVTSFEDLTTNANKAVGKIVVYNFEYLSYGESGKYRLSGASEAAKVGAVATLVRSLTPFSLNTPHTGVQIYQDGVTQIPTASITLEDAAMLQRMQNRGQRLEIHLTMGAINLPDITTRNSIIEVAGTQLPDEVVIVSGHLDSWDVGQGAMDDGGGAMVSWNAALVLHRLGFKPRRTVRAILWSAEEQKAIGGEAYYNSHSSEKEKFQLILESDSGTFNPLGLSLSGTNEASCIIQEILSLTQAINTTQLSSSMADGPDVELWAAAGLPTGSLDNDNGKYFYFHHTEGDTLSVEDPDILDKTTALWASVAFVAADLSQQIPRVYT